MNGSIIASPSIPWQLIECTSADRSSRIVPISANPFTIGRLPDRSLFLPSPGVSKLHAELIFESDSLWVRDLGSTNGTFVNERRVTGSALLKHDDLLQVASDVFRVQRQTGHLTARTVQGLSFDKVQALCQFDRLMTECAVIPHFQPIVLLESGAVIGHEILARGTLDGLKSPADMFEAAERLHQEAALSMMLRREGLRHGGAAGQYPILFVNTHPKEVVTEQFLDSLSVARSVAPQQQIVVEIHEAAVTDPQSMKTLRERLTVHDMRLAFDDFGAGQARLDELSEFPPDYVKFDIKLIRNIHQASPQRTLMISRMVALVRDLGATPLAEGVESVEEAKACADMGFHLAQGYFFGRPTAR